MNHGALETLVRSASWMEAVSTDVSGTPGYPSHMRPSEDVAHAPHMLLRTAERAPTKPSPTHLSNNTAIKPTPTRVERLEIVFLLLLDGGRFGDFALFSSPGKLEFGKFGHDRHDWWRGDSRRLSAGVEMTEMIPIDGKNGP